MTTERNPYWVRLRGCGGPSEWDEGRRFGGADFGKGVEVYLGTEQGAVILRLWADDEAQVRFRLVRIQHKDARGLMQGEARHIVEGKVRGGRLKLESDIEKLLQQTLIET